MSRWIDAFIGALLRPRPTFIALAARPLPRAAGAAMVLTASLYSLFCLLLWLRGEQPSFTLAPLPPAGYYLWQALFLVPLFLVLWSLFALVGHGFARAAGGSGSLEATRTVIGFAYGPPLLVAFVLPDLTVYLLFGFEALTTGMRLYAPLTVLWIVALATFGIHRAHRIGLARAAGIALAAFLLQAAVGGLLLR